MPFVKHSDAADGGNGAATDCHDFIDNKLITFITSSTHFPAAADRWTLEREDVVVVDAESEFFLSPPSNAADAPVVAFHTRDSAGYIFGGTSYVAGTEAYALPGNTRQHPQDGASTPDWANVTNDRHLCSWTNIWPTSGLTAHWLYAPANGAYCYAVIQLAARRFRHIMFGQFDKFASAMSGGEFFGAQYWGQAISEIDTPYDNDRQHSSPIVAAASSLGSGRQAAAFRALGLRTGAAVGDTAEWHFGSEGFSGGNPQDNISRPTGAGSPPWDTQNNSAIDVGRAWCDSCGPGGPGTSVLFEIQQSIIANVKPLLPLSIWALGFSEGQNRYMPVGQLPDIFRVNMSGFTEGQDVVVGSDTYSVFPIVNSDQVNTVSNDEYSAFEGFAIRQIP